MLAGEILAAAMVTPRETPPAFPGGRRADTPRARQGSGPPELEGVPAQHSRPPHSAPLCCAQAALPDGPGCPLAAAPAPSRCPHCRQPRGHLEAPPSQPGPRKPLRTPGTSPPGGECRGPCLVAWLPGAASTRHVTPISRPRWGPLGAWWGLSHGCTPSSGTGLNPSGAPAAHAG